MKIIRNVAIILLTFCCNFLEAGKAPTGRPHTHTTMHLLLLRGRIGGRRIEYSRRSTPGIRPDEEKVQ